MKTTRLILLFMLSPFMVLAQNPLDARLLRNVKENRFDSVRILVEKGANVNYCDSNNAPVLMWAALNGDLKMVKYLISKGADVKKKGIINRYDSEYIFGNIAGIAAGRGDLPMLKFLIEECGIAHNDKELAAETKTETGWTPLTYALRENDSAITNYLVGKDNSLNASELYSISSYLHVNYDSLIFKRIDEYRGSDLKRKILAPILFRAIRDGHDDFISRLLKYHPDFTMLNEDTLTPLGYSIVFNRPGIARMLIDQGAPVDQPCYDRKTPLFFASEIGDSVLFDYLLQHGADINRQDTFGRTPLYFSILLENEAMARFILGKNPDPSLCTFDQDTPAMLAEELGFTGLSISLNERTRDKVPCRRTLFPRLMLPPAKRGYENIQISTNHKFLAAGSSGYLYIYDLHQKRLIRNYRVPERNYTFFKNCIVSLDHDLRIVFFSINRDERIKIFPAGITFIDHSNKFAAGNLLAYQYYTIDPTLARLTNPDAFPDGISSDYQNTVVSTNTIELLDLQNQRIIESFVGILEGLSKDYMQIAIFNNDSLCIVNRIKNTITKIPWAPEVFNNGVESSLNQAIVSNDGRYASLYHFYYPGNTWISDRSDSILLIDIRNQTTLPKIAGYPSRMWFSESGKMFATTAADRWHNTNESHLYIYRLTENSGFKLDKDLAGISDFCVSAGEKWFFLTTLSGKIIRFDPDSGSMEEIFSGEINNPVALSADSSNNLAIFTTPGSLIDWDLSCGKFISSRKIEGPAAYSRFSFMADGMYGIAADSSFHDLYQFRCDTGPLVPRHIFHSGKRIGQHDWFSLLPGMERVMFSSKAKLQIMSFKGDTLRSFFPISNYGICHHALSKDEKFMALASGYYAYDTLTGEEYDCTRGAFCVLDLTLMDTLYQVRTSYHIRGIRISPDGNQVWVTSDNGDMNVFSLKANQPVGQLIIPGSVRFSKDRFMKYHLCEFLDAPVSDDIYIRTHGKLLTIDPVTIRIKKEATIGNFWNSPVLSHNNKWLIYPSEGGGTGIWDIATERELCTLFNFDSTDYVIRAPNGVFDASPGAMKKMSFVAGMETIDLEQLKQRYYQPGLLPALLGYSDEKPRHVPALDYVRLFPTTDLSVMNDQLSIRLKNRGGGIGKVSVYLDNIEIIRDARPGGDLDTSRSEMTVTVELDKFTRFYRFDTTNTIKVITWNSEGYLSSRPDSMHYKPSYAAKGIEMVRPDRQTIRPHLYGLVVGTSDYAGTSIDLRYAAKDAKDLYQALYHGAIRLFGKENVTMSLLTTDTTGKEPSQENIFKELMTMRKASPDDIVIVYFSGHGVNYGGQDGEFYYLTMSANGADAAYLNDPMIRNHKAISSQDMALELNQIPARKKVLILDACSSGQAANNLLATLKEIPSSQRRALEFTQDATGSFILASSAANSASYETPRFGHGLLTYALLKGIRGAQLKKIEDGEFIDVEQLLQYAKMEVPLLAGDIQGIQEPIYRNPGGRSFIIGQMLAEDKAQIILDESKWIFLPCQFSSGSEDLTAQEIDIGEKLNTRLDQLSAKRSVKDIQFARTGNFPDACVIKGRYFLKKDKIEITWLLKRGDQPVDDIQKESSQVSRIDELLDKIILKVITMITNGTNQVR